MLYLFIRWIALLFLPLWVVMPAHTCKAFAQAPYHYAEGAAAAAEPVIALTTAAIPADTTPAQLAQQQLDAYNARDIDAFLEPYAEDVELYNFPNQPISVGKDRMRRSYGKLFAETPDLHCVLVDRLVMGDTVIDQERVTFRKGEPPLNAIAIYKVRDGKIAQVYFITK